MIKEANISYSPEKIDEFVEQLTKEVESAKRIFETALEKVKGMGIGEIVDNISTAEAYREKITRAIEAIDKKHTMYFDIVNMYGVSDLPSNVRQLEKLTDKLDDYRFDLSRVEDVLEAVISVADKLTDFYSEK